MPESPAPDHNSVAIVGMAGRFPGARNLTEFWRNLEAGVESIARFSEEEVAAAGVPLGELARPGYVRARGILDEIDRFDASFFGLTPREAELMDPQHRLFLECAWEALEDAGYDAERYAGSIGVYAGAGMNTYLLNNLLPGGHLGGPGPIAYDALIGNMVDFLATRVSYKLNLRGPAYTVQTACSTSLVAVHLACQALIHLECDMAIAGGVSIQVPQQRGYLHHEGGIVSPDGYCRAFDARAQGTVFGNGIGVVVLKRLDEALRDGDPVRAVIRGSATNNDGSLKVGYTAPSVAGQMSVIVEALSVAGVEPDTLSYVEAHGTGTALGDPTEITALAKAFRTGTARNGFCAIGSVKSNLGHLDAAAGIAGLLKTVLALQHRTLPASLHFEQANPAIRFEDTPFYVNAARAPWPSGPAPRRAGVSSFGFGGTNAHVVLEEAPEASGSSLEDGWHLLVLSARSAAALEAASARLARHLSENPTENLADVAYTLQAGRRLFGHRKMVVCKDLDGALQALRGGAPEYVASGFQEQRGRPVTFLVPGSGEPADVWGLCESIDVCSAELSRCAELFVSELGVDLRALCQAGSRERTILVEPRLAQPALFAVEYALARLWLAWGVRPSAMIGYGVGEYVVASLRGAMSLDDAVKLATARGRALQGGMSETGDRCEESLGDPETVLLEVGPGPGAGLTRAALQSHAVATGRVVLPSGGASTDPLLPLPRLLHTAGRLWLAGVDVDLLAQHQGRNRRRVPLPTYRFERKRFWIESEKKPEPLPPARLGPVRSGARKGPDDWLYRHEWQEQALPISGVNGATDGAGWLVLGGEDGVTGPLVSHLRLAGHDVVTATSGERFASLGDASYSLRTSERDDYESLLAALEGRGTKLRYIAHLLSLTPKGIREPTSDVLDNGFYSLLALAQAWGRLGGSRSLRLGIVSNQLQHVLDGDVVRPEKAALLGPCRVIPHEYPAVSCRSIDVLVPEDGETHRTALAAALVAEVCAEAAGTAVVAYRGIRRWVQTVEHLTATAPSAVERLREKGTYLITGGLGGVGLTLAEHLARAMEANLVLVGRSGGRLPDALEELGARVMVARADVCDRERMRAVIREAIERFGAIHGVIHAAGVPGAGVLQRKTRAAAAAVLAPKVQGLAVLDELLSGMELDFFALCSSLSTLLGPPGQADYCAANAVLDAYANVRTDAPGRLTVSINWDRWENVGMAAHPAVATAYVPAAIGRDGQVEIGHPLLQRHDRTAPDGVYLSQWRSDEHWFLNEHRIGEHAVLPATAYLEMARAAGEHRLGAKTLDMRDLSLLAPLAVPDSQTVEVRTRLIARGDYYDIQVASRLTGRAGAAEWREHARGRIAALEPPAAGVEDVAAIQARCQRREVPEHAADEARRGPLTLGSRWQRLVQGVWIGEREALAHLVMPDGPDGELGPFQLHPALLDVACTFAVVDRALYLPFTYGRVRVYAPVSRRMYSWARRRGQEAEGEGSLHFDLTIMDESGSPAVEIEDLVLRRRDEGSPLLPSIEAPDGRNARLELGTPGIPQSLRFVVGSRRRPAAGEVEIEVDFVGLNFRDVLMAVGERPRLPEPPPSFGSECSGRVSALGEGVSGFELGAEVVAVVPDCFRAFVVAPIELVAPRPGPLTLDEAAAMSIPFLTACHALERLARLSAGERILIHAAAGGVGLAAVSVAQRIGAEVFATAGSAAKRGYLQTLGIQHVMDSRSLAFADQVLERTGGRGVDVVLNSLSGEAAARSLAVLAPFGRFVEIGKRDIYQSGTLDLRPFEKGLSFHAVRLDAAMPGFPELFREVMARFENRSLAPLPCRTFLARDIVEAFDHMARAKHVGRVAVCMNERPFAPRSASGTGLAPDEAVQLFRSVLRGNAAQVIVSVEELAPRLRKRGVEDATVHAQARLTSPVTPARHGRPDLDSEYVAPRNPSEALLAEIWQQVLGIERVGIHDDFFVLGGASLQGLEIAARAEEAGLAVNAALILEYPTIAGLVLALATGGEAEVMGTS